MKIARYYEPRYDWYVIEEVSDENEEKSVRMTEIVEVDFVDIPEAEGRKVHSQVKRLEERIEEKRIKHTEEIHYLEDRIQRLMAITNGAT